MGLTPTLLPNCFYNY